jgi:hypothetical protein
MLFWNNYFIFIRIKVCVEESIVSAPFISLQSKIGKNTNNAKSEVRFKQLIRDL